MVDTAVSLVGAVSIIIPIVNMISVSLPDETVATGLGLNTMLRNIGGAIGPVVATTILSTYTVKVPVPPGTALPPSSAAFDYIFYIGILTMICVVILSLAGKNYVFRKQKEA
jgi:MFS family permease